MELIFNDKQARYLRVMARHYTEAVYFTDASTDEDEIPASAALSFHLARTILQDCRAFIRRAWPLLADHWPPEQAGHDLWLTRNGHGAGFWDRGMPYGDRLTELAQELGAMEVYLGDDGRIWC